MSKISIELSQEDLGTLIICAVRYCQGRETYMPSLVLGIVKPFVSKLSDKDLGVLISDYQDQQKRGAFGNDYIDKPFWIKWGDYLYAERNKRREV